MSGFSELQNIIGFSQNDLKIVIKTNPELNYSPELKLGILNKIFNIWVISVNN